MSFPQHPAFALRAVPQRPIKDVEQEIFDELEFHIEMRALDNGKVGMSADKARQNALQRFGDYERIHKACRKALLGERIMLQRIQAILTVVLLGAVVLLGIQLNRSQHANEAAIACIAQVLEHLSGPAVIDTVPNNDSANVDPSLTEIRVTYNRAMSLHSWSWCQSDVENAIYPETTGDPHYEPDKKTCVLPVKLEPGKSYAIRLNSGPFRNFMDETGKPAIPYLLQFKTRE